MKVNTRVIVSTNTDSSGRLINGQIGTVNYFAINQNEVESIRVAFDDILTKKINENDIIARKSKWVLIKKEKASIYLNKFRINSPATLESVSTYGNFGHGYVQFTK